MTLIINISAGSSAGLVLFIIVVMVIRICKRRLKQPETQKTDETGKFVIYMNERYRKKENSLSNNCASKSLPVKN